ncbi:MAG: hypothetical protein IJN74_07720 [Clostridia bacterium]|nr:hypothetical protein [Clostridia bacterium]
MIDLHTHVLPGIDDGPKKAEESIRMLADAYKQGVRLCGATPHVVLHQEDAIAHFIKKRQESYRALSAEMEKASLSFPKLILGAEVFLDHDITRHDALKALCLEETPYILVEFPLSAPYNPYWSEWLHSLIVRGFRPIVAHIDRYLHAEKMLSDFHGLAITYQINAARFRSFSGRRFVGRLLSEAAPCIVGSDMHNMAVRNCDIQIAFTKANKKFPKKAEALFSGTAMQMLKPYFGGEKYDKIAY